jgi:DtxR family Mn-dependent transcriptional regulator
MVPPNVGAYLKAIYGLQDDDTRVAPSAVATAMGVKPPTVTTMLQRMHDDGVIDYERYQGGRLTPRGEKRALEIVRHHRLLELFFIEQLGYDWSEVHDEAEVFEHSISERVETRTAALLGFPTVDPHGAPIPTVDLEIQQDGGQQSVEQCNEGTVGVVSAVRDSSPDVLDYLVEAGVTLGTQLQLTEVAPFGLITLELEEIDEQFSVPPETATNSFVSSFAELSTDESGQFSEAH